MEILSAVLTVGGIGLVIGVVLSIVGKFLRVEADEKETAIRKALPGNNCGGCGYPGCDSLAVAIAKGECDPGACPVGGVTVASQIAKIMGTKATVLKKTAYVACAGDCDKAKDKYHYYGNASCVDAVHIPGGGAKSCTYGCLGLGSCVKVCEFDAIHIENGRAVVDSDQCKACGQCVAVCPKNLISMIPAETKYMVECSSKDKGKDVVQGCSVGCIGCGICAKNCPHHAIEFHDNLAEIQQEKCAKCGVCAEKCPRNIIKMIK